MTASYDRASVEKIIASLGERVSILEDSSGDLPFAAFQLGSGVSATIPVYGVPGVFLGVGASGIYTNDSSFFQNDGGYVVTPKGGCYLILAGARAAVATDTFSLETTCEIRGVSLNTWGYRQAVNLASFRDISYAVASPTSPLNMTVHAMGIYFRNLEGSTLTGNPPLTDRFRFNVFASTGVGKTVVGGGCLIVRLCNVPYALGGIGGESGSFI